MHLSSTQIQELTGALVAAFYKKTSLAQMVRFSLNENLDVVAGGTDLGEIAFNLVQWAEAHEKLEDLLIGARRQNSGNNQLKAISQELLATTLDVSQDQLEAIVLKSAKFVDIEHWIEQISQCSQAVCRIEFPAGTARGTGFLLGSNIAISNYHVIRDIISNPSLKDDLALRFQYKAEREGKKQHDGIVRQLTEKNWIITSSPVDKLDYVLLRVNMTKNDKQTNPVMKPQKHTFTQREPLCIIQHPQGNPQKVALGSICQIKADQSRIYYTTNTLKGSSGAPCMNSDGVVIALHQGENDEASNTGIPFSAIFEDLRKKNLLSVLDI